MNKKTALMVSVLGIISIVLVTAGVTFAFFSYAKQGTTENSIKTGSITFIYEEVDKQGSGISIENAFPVSDSTGKAQSATKEVFNFKVRSENGNFDIPYTITARMSDDSKLAQDAVKVYLTEVVGDSETALLESIYEDLTDYSNAPNGKTEKVLHSTKVPAGSTGYEKNYRLRMWIPSTIDFSPVQENGVDKYPYNDKKFTLTINVYANAEVVSVPEVPQQRVAYYSFGLPTTTSATTFSDVIAESGSSTFAKLEEEQLSVCIYQNESLECFKNNSYEEEGDHLISLFGEDKCIDGGSIVSCANDLFDCATTSNGQVMCKDITSDLSCIVSPDGNVNCY